MVDFIYAEPQLSGLNFCWTWDWNQRFSMFLLQSQESTKVTWKWYSSLSSPYLESCWSSRYFEEVHDGLRVYRMQCLWVQGPWFKILANTYRYKYNWWVIVILVIWILWYKYSWWVIVILGDLDFIYGLHWWIHKL